MIFYHVADLDGHSSGAIAKKFLPTHKLVPFNYGYDVPWNKIAAALRSGEDIFLVDVSFPVEDMLKLNSACASYGCSLVWIDHHQLPVELRSIAAKGKHEIGRAACELVWEYFSKEPCPLAIRLIGAYDVWNFNPVKDYYSFDKFDKAEIIAFQYGMRQINTDPRTFCWDNIINNHASVGKEVFRIIREGFVILTYQQERDKHLKYTLCRHLGHDAIMINAQGINSNAFENVCEAKGIDLSGLLMVSYYEFGGKRYYSLYTQSDNIDCSALARAKGGGGHKKAAGYNEII